MDSLRLALTLLFSVSIVNAKPHLRHLTTADSNAECDYAAVGGSNESECSAAPATPTEHPLTCSARVNFTETTYYNFFNGTVRDESDDVKYNQTILSFHQVDQVVVFQAGLLFTPGEAEIVVLDNNRGALAFGARCSENDTLEVRYYFPDCKGYTAAGKVSGALYDGPDFPLGGTFSDQSVDRDWDALADYIAANETLLDIACNFVKEGDPSTSSSSISTSFEFSFAGGIILIMVSLVLQ